MDISASCIEEVVFALAVVHQSVRQVGSCSLDIKVRYCRMQGRRRRRGVRLKVGGGRRRAIRGKTTCRGRGALAGRSRRRRRAERKRRRNGGRGEPLWAAVRQSGRDGALPSKIAVWLHVRRVQGRRRRRRVRLKVGRGRRRANRGKPTCRGRGA